MERKPFYLKKVSRKKEDVWTVSFLDEETGEIGKYIVVSKVRDTLGLHNPKYDKINKYKAIEICNIAVDKGYNNSVDVNSKYSDYTFEEYFKLIWNFEESPYIKEKNYIRQKVGIDYARNKYRLFDNHIKKAVPKNIKLNRVKLLHLEKILSVMHDNNCSINLMVSVKQSITVVFNYAYRMEVIYRNPSERFGKRVSTVANKEKGILSKEELKQFLGKLDSLYASGNIPAFKYVAIKLAYFTGMRSSEIRALNYTDIEPLNEDSMLINIKHSLEDHYKLKSTKGGKIRKVLVPIELGKLLVDLGKNNPSGSGVVVWTPIRTLITPLYVNCDYISSTFKNLLKEIGITEEIRKKRRLTFSSLRHMYVTSIGSIFGISNAQVLVGHADLSTTQIYTHSTEEIMNKSLQYLKDNIT